jgi:hypothetical protein
MGQRDDFEMANKAFELMTLAERELVLQEFARLRYPSIIHRSVLRCGVFGNSRSQSSIGRERGLAMSIDAVYLLGCAVGGVFGVVAGFGFGFYYGQERIFRSWRSAILAVGESED